MDIELAKKAVVRAGLLLVKEGLIQRTWGNVSCRISDDAFVITPSGRDYLSLTPEDIVTVNIHDLSYEGSVKPSSEKGIHAQCYALRPEVNFVIHTHQTYASLLGLSGRDINGITGEEAGILGDNVPLAAYGLPGTGKLRKGVVNALKRSGSNAVLMFHHGALCLGDSLESAFRVANTLESVCKNCLLDRFRQLTEKPADSFRSVALYVAGTLQRESGTVTLEPFDSERVFGEIVMTPADGGEPISVDASSGLPLDPNVTAPDTAKLHAAIYRKRPGVNAIVHSKEDATLALSTADVTVKPFLDDFAQIVGVTMRTAAFDPDEPKRAVKKTLRKLRGRDAVMLKRNGAICVGSDKEEAEAVKLVAEKGCKAFAAAHLLNCPGNTINPAESLLMRTVYKLKYAKKK